MTVRRLAEDQPASFAFTAENSIWAGQQITKYPEGRQFSAIIPLLWRAQEQSGGWLPQKAIEHVADLLGMPYIRALEVATFYTMFNLAPVGRYYVQLCGTTPCALRGAEDLKTVCRQKIGDEHHVTADGTFSWVEVECLGACVNAPMVQINADYYEDITPDILARLLDEFAAGKAPPPGPQNGRQFSAPLGGPTTLTDPSLYTGGKGNGSGVPDAAAAPIAPSPPATADSSPIDSAADALARAEEAEIAAKLASLPKTASAEEKANAVGARPAGLAAARDGRADELQRIRGIGKVNEQRLHALGIFHFDQVAGWTRDEVRWVGTYLAFPGRIDREDWRGQAKVLAADGTGTAANGGQPQGKA